MNCAIDTWCNLGARRRLSTASVDTVAFSDVSVFYERVDSVAQCNPAGSKAARLAVAEYHLAGSKAARPAVSILSLGIRKSSSLPHMRNRNLCGSMGMLCMLSANNSASGGGRLLTTDPQTSNECCCTRQPLHNQSTAILLPQLSPRHLPAPVIPTSLWAPDYRGTFPCRRRRSWRRKWDWDTLPSCS